MKKVLLSSVAALAVFAAAAPAFANDNPSINGGANTPGAFDSREAYENQSEFVSARTVEEYLNGHMEDISAEAAQDPAVVAAKAEFDAVEGGSHLYGEKKAAYEAAFNTSFLNVRNKYVKQFQTVQNTAKKKEGRYYILNETPEQANARYLKEHGISQEEAAKQSKEEAAKAEEAAKKAEAGKAGSKQAGKALPKTSAVK
ncbi:amylase-binding protein [Streptococcus rubneri]|jgi:amylase-binding protein abpA|uniref:Amylase-binding protein n=1 Tax=Streptococcus rubneri TaxID=1234680 RepID=A0A4Z1DRP7_9STRE|nr:amylase-binding adhesin AbpA [Streptococcus rubneri]MBK4773427.1 amylase-binding protein [Streptococcus rubneri]TGN90965.1 amylase-binding protein [Streptococcus rubneri]